MLSSLQYKEYAIGPELPKSSPFQNPGGGSLSVTDEQTEHGGQKCV